MKLGDDVVSLLIFPLFSLLQISIILFVNNSKQPILFSDNMLFDIPAKTICLHFTKPETFVTGWNRLLQRSVDVEARSDLFKPFSVMEVEGGTIPSRVRVRSRSWFFTAPNESTKTKEQNIVEITEPQEQLELLERDSNDEFFLQKQAVETLTRISIPRDAVKIQDRLHLILQPPIESILNLPSLTLPFEPFLFQRQGIAFLYSSHSAILADEMGLGKTMQAITTIRLLLRTGEVRSVLLVCPKPLITNWQREFATWAPEVSVHVIDGSPIRRKWLWQQPNVPVRLANYELLSRDREFFDLPEEETLTKFDLVVLDESQRIKNKGNTTSEAARAIPRVRNWALTGTPVENSQEDIVGIFEFLSPGILDSGLKPTEICDLVGDRILRRTKDHVKLQIPPKMIYDVRLDLSPEQADSYQKAEEEGVYSLKEAGENATSIKAFELIIKLKQICNFDPLTGESAKLNTLLANMEEVAQSGQKAIVFSQWVQTLYRLKAALEHFGTTEYHGKIPTGQRDEMIRRFREDSSKHVILMSYGAGSVGLNLQFAGYVFLFDRWWNPAVEDQAINRAHRIGAAGPVTVKRFISTNTVEERINQTLENKRELSELILAGAQGINYSIGLNQDELFGLFNLPAPTRLKKSA